MMSKVLRRTLAVVLVVSLLLTSNVSVFAAAEEEYLSDLRIIYAEDFSEAKEILSDTEFKDYTLLNENLNEGTKEIGVWLAYKTTTDIEDAITDISVIQMNGGYQEGNYQEMIKESMEEYTKLGKTYLQAVDYFVEAYDAGDYLADAAYRQLNFYTPITDEELGIKIPDYDGELLGDILYDGVDAEDLATIFLQGNVHVLQNIRSLLAMGVSYNEDGTHYLEKVAQEAENADSYEDGEYDELALLISGSVLTFQDMFKELSACEDEMDYSDDQITDLELEYAEHKSLADRMREVEYLDGQSLYDFCLGYKLDKSDLSSLYPLAAALNDGQAAMTKVAHYYDVVRYSMSDYPEDALNELITEQEELYKDSPFNIYNGVDRSVYYGSFALTSEAYRADAYTEEGFLNHMFKEQAGLSITSLVSLAGAPAMFVWAIRRTAGAKQAAAEQAKALAQAKDDALYVARYLKDDAATSASSAVGGTKASVLGKAAADYGQTYNTVAENLIVKYKISQSLNNPFNTKLTSLMNNIEKMNSADAGIVEKMQIDYQQVLAEKNQVANAKLTQAQNMTTTVNTSISGVTVAIYIAGGLMLLYSAVGLTLTVVNYYNPNYDDIPVALVDLIETVDGDRYIKYDVVREAEEKKDGVYAAGDLNAFEAQRWNALYYTKSYEAGKPLLADEFTVSTSNNKPKDGYTPVHRFGEEVCYDLNKYNFSDKTPSIYLSVKQSKNDKSAVADVPKVVGSIFGSGLWMMFGGVGAIFGVGGTLGTQALLKKKNKNRRIKYIV